MKTCIISFFTGAAALSFALLFSPFAAFASSHNFTCAEFAAGSTAACTGTMGTFAGDGKYLLDQNGTAFNMSNATVYYLNATVVRTSGTGEIRANGSTNDGSFSTFTTTLVDLPFTTANGNSWNGALIYDNASFIGTLDNICITDTVGECAGGGGGGSTTTATSTAPFNKQESMFIFGFFVFILSVPFWEKTLTVTSKRFDV